MNTLKKFVLRATQMALSLYLWMEATHDARALEGRHVSSKSLSRVQDGDKGVAGSKDVNRDEQNSN